MKHGIRRREGTPCTGSTTVALGTDGTLVGDVEVSVKYSLAKSNRKLGRID